jgi:hypothetical protein
MSRDHNLVTHQHAQAGSQNKGKESNSETQPNSTFHKGDILTNSIALPDKISGKVCYIYPKDGKLQGEANSMPPQQQVPGEQKVWRR